MDKYDEAIEFYKKNPDLIGEQWSFPSDYTHGCLFQFLGVNIEMGLCGCAAQIKNEIRLNSYIKKSTLSIHPEINKYIEENDFPIGPSYITVDNLHLFANVQRMADKLGRN